MSGLHRNPAIVVIDAMELRRTGFISVIAPWAHSEGIDLLPLKPSEAYQELEKEIDCKMLIFCFGGANFKRENWHQVKVLHAFASAAYLVVVSDLADPDEVVAAFEAGARGFVHYNLRPDLAIQALSFILKGGTYFPPSAMQQLTVPLKREVDAIPASSSASDTSDFDESVLHFVSHESWNVVRPVRHFQAELVVDHGSAHLIVINSNDHQTPGNDRLDGSPHDLSAQELTLTPRQRLVLDCLRQGQPNKVIGRRLSMAEGTVKVHVRQIMRKLGAANRTQVAVCAIGVSDGNGKFRTSSRNGTSGRS